MEKRELAYLGVIAFLLIGLGLTLGAWLGKSNDEVIISQTLDQVLRKYPKDQPNVKMVRNPSDSSLIALQSQVILNQAAASRLELSKIRTSLGDLKRISDRINITTGYLIKNLETRYDSSAVLKNLDDGTYLKLPYTSTISDLPHFTLTTTQTLKGTRLDSLRLWDNSELIIGFKRKGFFRKSEPSVLFRNRNKYLTDFNMANVRINYRKPFYETRLFNMALGALSLYGAQKGIQYLQK
jgi:hypothetical protein